MADEAEKTRINLREKKEKISRRWTQIEDTQMDADKIRVNLREKKRLFHADGRRLKIRRWTQRKSA